MFTKIFGIAIVTGFIVMFGCEELFASEGVLKSSSAIGAEFLIGSLAAYTGMFLGDLIGHAAPIAYPFGTGDDVASLGEISFIQLGSMLGGFIGVYGAGRAFSKPGQAIPTLIGSAVGSSTVLVAMFLPFSIGKTWTFYLLSNIFLPATGATIGFNLTKGKEQKDSAPNLQMQLSQISNHRYETDYTLRLLAVRF